MPLILVPADVERAVQGGLLELGQGSLIETGVEICHPTRAGEARKVVIGSGSLVRSSSVLYSGIRLGDDTQCGHHVVLRENTTVGDHSVIGTGVKVEGEMTIGNHVLIETQAHITAYMTIEDYAFVGPGCITTNDWRMLWKRPRCGEERKGPTLKWGCRIGGGSVILPGVVVGREAIVGAGSVVAKDVPDRMTVAGNPARLIGPVSEDEPVLVEV